MVAVEPLPLERQGRVGLVQWGPLVGQVKARKDRAPVLLVWAGLPREANLEGRCVTQFEEISEIRGHEGICDLPLTKTFLVVAVVDTDAQLLEEWRGQEPAQLCPDLGLPLFAKEVDQDIRPVHLGEIVLMNDVQPTKLGAHLSAAGLQPQGKLEQRHVGLVDPDFQLPSHLEAAVCCFDLSFLGKLEIEVSSGIRVHTPGKTHLHDPREDPILPPGKCPCPSWGLFLSFSKGSHEVPSDSEIEQELSLSERNLKHCRA